jgi:hypothetical protein
MKSSNMFTVGKMFLSFRDSWRRVDEAGTKVDDIIERKVKKADWGMSDDNCRMRKEKLPAF